jgi:hypothetical protein
LGSLTESFAAALILAAEFSPHLVEAENVAEDRISRYQQFAVQLFLDCFAHTSYQ